MRKSKLFIVGLFLLLCQVSLYSQEPNRQLFNNKTLRLSTFHVEVAPMTYWSQLNDQKVNVLELSGGLILENGFYLSYFLATSPKINKIRIPEIGSDKYFDWIEAGVELDKVSLDAEFLQVKFRHSGIKAGYMHNPSNMLFWRAGLAFGFSGGLSLTEDQTFLGLFDNKVYETKVFSLEPNIGLGVNLLSWWRLYLDFGYRVLTTDPRIITSADADSFTLSLTFGFGRFSPVRK